MPGSSPRYALPFLQPGDAVALVDEVNRDLIDRLELVLDDVLTGPQGETGPPGAAVIGTGQPGYVTIPNGTAAANRTQLQTDAAAAASAGVPLIVVGTFSVAGTVTIPANGVVIHAYGARITQTTDVTPIFTVVNRTGFELAGGTFIGKSTDYIDDITSTGWQYASSVVRATGSTGVRIHDVSAFGFGGPLLYSSSCVGVWVDRCTVIGVGVAGGYGTIVWRAAAASKNNPGLIFDGPSSNVWVTANDFSHLAQGILGGLNADVHLLHNRMHDIGGQHGIYMNNTLGLEIVGNVARRCAANGIKVQLSTLGSGDHTDLIITGNIVSDCDVMVAVLVNSSWPSAGADRFRRLVIADNVGLNLAEGVIVQAADGFTVNGNIIRSCSKTGMRIEDCVNGEVMHNLIRGTGDEGIRLVSGSTPAVVNCSNIRLADNRIIDPASLSASTTEFGISNAGASSNNLTFQDNWITEAGGVNMRYGIYIASGDQTTMDIVGNRVSGASDYGFRGVSGSAIRTFRDNDFQGGIGRITGVPVSGRGDRAVQYFAAAAPTTGLWVVGDKYWNITPAASGYMGWVCTTAGRLDPLWVASTAYVVGDYRTNGTRVYIVTTAGTSAASGGPTGTGTGIADGTVVWNYVTTVAVWKAFGPVSA